MPYNSTSASDRLSAVRDSIAKCLEAQAYGVGNRNKSMANLKTLREMEKELQQEVNQPSGGMATVGQFTTPTG